MAGKTADIAEIRKVVKSKELLIGTDEVMKNLKLGKITKVYLTSNCPSKIKKDLEYYAGLCKADLFNLDIQNTELGVVCKKPYSVSVLALIKGGK